MVFRRSVLPPALAAGFCLIGSCAHRPTYLKKSEFPQLPIAEASARWQERAERSPELKEKLYWKNYGGPGNRGGRPADEMDWLFYRHDLAYLEGVRLRSLRSADRELVRDLRAIDPGALDEAGRRYRKRAILFFSLPVSRWVGKPGDIVCRTRRGPEVIWVEETK